MAISIMAKMAIIENGQNERNDKGSKKRSNKIVEKSS
jgi:hypothetical protein